MPKFKKDTDFKNPEPGLYLMEGVEITFDDRSNEDDGKGGKKGVLATVKSKTLEGHADSLGLNVQDTFPLWTPFGFERFGGLMVCAFPKGFKMEKDYPMGHFNDAKIQNKIQKGFGGIHFGSNVRHDKVLKQGASAGSKEKNDYLIFAKLGSVYDTSEYEELTKKEGKAAKEAPAASGSKGDNAGGGEAASGDDDWA